MKHGLVLVVVAGCTESARPVAAVDQPVTCGDAPYAELDLAVRPLDMTSLAAPVHVQFTGCDWMKTDEAGDLHALISTSVPRAIQLQSNAYAPAIFPERVLPEGPVALELTAISWAVAEATPGYCVDGGNIEVQIVPGDGACASADGAVVEIADHPELVPLYLDGPETFASGAAATSSYGVAMFGKLPTPGVLDVVVHKPGCAVEVAGRLPTAPGAIGAVVAQLVTP